MKESLELASKSFAVGIKGHHLLADLMVLNMKDFGVILGIDWLATYHALVDSFVKRMTFQIPRLKELNFSSSRVGAFL